MSSIAKQTAQLDGYRGLFEGALSASSTSVAQVVLIEVFLRSSGELDGFSQAMIFSSSFIGMFLSLFYGSLSRYFHLTKSLWVGLPMFVSAICFFASAFAEDQMLFLLLCCVAHACGPIRMPYLTELHHDNYPKEKRGVYTSYSLIALQIGGLIFSYGAGHLLSEDVSHWKYIYIGIGLSQFVAALLMSRIPSQVSKMSKTVNPFGALRWIVKDKSFAYLLFAWFLFGFGNLWIYPLRITYLVEVKELDPFWVMMLATVAMEGARLLFLPMWAYLFDRMNFIVLRIFMNCFFVVGIAFYFLADSLWLIGLGSFFHGVGFSGGRLSWGLWVTKMVPASRSGEYMSVHVFLTGLRGIIGPSIGYMALESLGEDPSRYTTVAAISLALFVTSILMLVPMKQAGERDF